MPLSLPVTGATLPSNLSCVISDANWQALIATLRVTFGVDVTFVNLGNVEPIPANRIWPWKRTNSDGSPDRDYVYWNGRWTARHPIPPGGGSMLFTGTEADIATYDGGGGGVLADVTPISGPMWLAVPEMAARFPVGPGKFADVGDVIGATIGIGDTGGEEKHVITLAEMPAHRHGLGENSSVFTGVPTGDFVVTTDTTPLSHKVQQFDTDGEDAAHNTLPPYRGVWIIRRTARVFYTL